MDSLSNMDCLVINYHRQIQYNESINQLNQGCLERRTIILGENHPDTLGTINNIGVAYEMLGSFDEALVYHNKDCYDIRCIVLVRYRSSS